MQPQLSKRDFIATLVVPFVSNFDKKKVEEALAGVTDADCEILGDGTGASAARFRSVINAPDGTPIWEFTRVNPGEFDPFKGMNSSGVPYWRLDSLHVPANVKFPR